MARLSEQIIAGLTRPSFSRGMFEAGQAIGAVPGMMRQQRRRGEEEQRQRGVSGGLFGLEQMVAEGVDPSEAVGSLVNLGADPALISEYAQRGETRRKAVLTEEEKAEEKRRTAAQGRGEGELMLLARNPEFNEKDPNQVRGYIGMADAYGVTRKRAMQILKDEKSKPTGKKIQSAERVILRDSVGNEFTQVNKLFTDGSSGQEIVPFEGNTAGETGAGTYDGSVPVGATSVVSRTTGAGAFDRPEIEGQVTEARDFATLRVNAVDSIAGIQKSIADTESTLELVDKIRQGGSYNALKREVENVLGYQPEDEAEFQFAAGRQVLQALSAFKGAISNAEREYLRDLYYSLGRSPQANRAILEQMLDGFYNALQDAQDRAESDNFEGYYEKKKSRSPRRKVKPSDPAVAPVSWNSLPS